jgi:hypothetical protein
MKELRCPHCDKPLALIRELANQLVSCPACDGKFVMPDVKEPVPPPVQLVPPVRTRDSCDKASTIVGSLSFDGFKIDVHEDWRGRRWGVFPRPFRLREELNDWLMKYGAYSFDTMHYVIDDPKSSTSVFLQVEMTRDGRYGLWFVSTREHWPPAVPLQAQRMLTTAEQAQRQRDTLVAVGAFLLGAAMLAPRTTHVYHH